MDLESVQAFYSLVQLGSMTKAAEAQFRTQSALSQQISRLEGSLGCRLLNRIGKKGFTLTPEGEEFYRFAEKILKEERDMMTHIRELQNGDTGTIRISSTHAALWVLPARLTSYRTAYPKVSLSFTERTPQEGLELLKKGQVDFSIIHGSSIPSAMRAYTWMRGRYMLVVPSSHALTGRSDITLQEISHYALNLATPHEKFSGRELFDRKFQELGLSYKILLETSNIFLNLRYTSLGFGISFMLCYEDAMELYHTDGVEYISMDHIFPSETISIVTREEELPDFKKNFLNMLLNRPDSTDGTAFQAPSGL